MKKIALIGCGVWGKNHARNLHQMGALAGIIDPSANGQTLASEYNVPLFADIASIKQTDNDISALVIASPDMTHYDYGMQALQAGFDVLMEKPLAMNYQHAEQLCDVAQQQKAILMVGHLLRYHPAFNCLLRVVKQGMIGEVQNIISIRHDVFDTPRDSDLLWGYGPHDASMIAPLANFYMSDGPQQLSNVSFYGDVTKEVMLGFAFSNGVQAQISLSWQAPKKRLLMVQGTQGQLVFDDAKPDGEKVIARVQDAPPQIISYKHTQPLLEELQHFHDMLVTRGTPLTDGREALAVMAMLDSINKISRGH